MIFVILGSLILIASFIIALISLIRESKQTSTNLPDDDLLTSKNPKEEESDQAEQKVSKEVSVQGNKSVIPPLKQPTRTEIFPWEIPLDTNAQDSNFTNSASSESLPPETSQPQKEVTFQNSNPDRDKTLVNPSTKLTPASDTHNRGNNSSQLSGEIQVHEAIIKSRDEEE